MRVLVLAEKKKIAENFVKAFLEKGITAKYLRLSKVMLVSKKDKTEIKLVGSNIDNFDAVFLQARSSLAPFVEPLLEELTNQGFYVNSKKGSYYLSDNEPYTFVSLAINNVKTPKTLTSGSGKNIERVSKNISYPLLVKSFVGKKAQQAIIANNGKELNSFVKSIKSDIEGFMLREYIDEPVISCIVVGDEVFSVKRKTKDQVVVPIDKGEYYKLPDSDKENVLNATKVIGLDIAKVDLVKGRVISIEPNINLKNFNKICSADIESRIVDFYLSKENEIKRKSIFSELKDIRSIFSKTIFGRFFK
ncbi:MAG: hypothetical protein GX950_00790 [Candidatus Diapherotrites archaeon]|uniref:ATP-grasp fold RimK-type domain-containing protein n=1 Tax=Candidatus Iainarchaeum sp. TaxID=3101447 RepID=A0A7K4BYQ7_9ARCH|nr:hypothetical protein [Candidatus Diapherotrites archaeon]